MKSSSIARYELCILSAVGLLVGCGGNAGIGAPTTSSGAGVNPHLKGKTFFFSGNAQPFTVPGNVHSINVVVRGAAGAQGCVPGARGARVFAVIPVTPGQRLIVYVGGQGTAYAGGFNGGGNSGGYYGGGGGGGASDVRVSPGRLRDRILVAAGGGAQGGDNPSFSFGSFGCGGAGGGLEGGDGGAGNSYGFYSGGEGGLGATQSAGGAGGAGGRGSASGCQSPGQAGANGTSGVGGSGGKQQSAGGGGGGGGGYFGGGGGGSSCATQKNDGGGGGGGGSSYAEPSAKNVHFWGAWKNATTDGLVVFSWP